MKRYELHKLRRGDVVFFSVPIPPFGRRPFLIMQDYPPLISSIYAYKITGRVRKKQRNVPSKLLVEIPLGRVSGLTRQSVIDCRKSNLVKFTRRELLTSARKIGIFPDDLMGKLENAIGNSDLGVDEMVAILPKFFESPY